MTHDISCVTSIRSDSNHVEKKSQVPDPDEIALIQWCTEVEELFIAAGATRNEAQAHIEDEAEWFTDLFYEGLTPEEAAREALN